MAPAAKLEADANEAWTGRAVNISDMPYAMIMSPNREKATRVYLGMNE